MSKKQEQQGAVYWVIDGVVKTYDVRHVIKLEGGYFEPHHKAWCVKNPTEKTITALRVAGLQLQFRRYE